LSTLARYSASGFHLYMKTKIYFILYPITYQNMNSLIIYGLSIKRKPLPVIVRKRIGKVQKSIVLDFRKIVHVF